MPPMMATTFIASHGLQTWALQVRTRIARQSEIASLHDMVTAQGEQWLDAYLEELLKAGPQPGGIAELVKTPGKKREGLKTRAVAANAAAKNAKLVSANKNADKENAPPAPQSASKKSTRFQRALMAVKDSQDADLVEAAVPAAKKRGRPKKAQLEVPLQERIDVVPNEEDIAAEEAVKPARPTKGKAAKGKKPKGKKAVQPESVPDSSAAEEDILVKEEPRDVPPASEDSALESPVDESPVHAPTSPTPRKTAPPIRPAISPLKMAALGVPVSPSDATDLETPLEDSPAPAPTSPTPKKTASPMRPHVSPLKMSPVRKAATPRKSAAAVEEDTLPEVDDLDDDLVPTVEEDEPASANPEAASLSIIREDEELNSPPNTQTEVPAAPSESSAPSFVPTGSQTKLPSPKLSQPSLDEFATAPLPTRPPRITLGATATNAARPSHANVGPPPVVLRPSVGLRSSWLTKALREDNGITSAPAPAPPAPTAPKAAPPPATAGVKRKSATLDSAAAPHGSAAPVIESEPATKVRKITPVLEKELSKSLKTEKVMQDEEDDGDKGILERVRGKVEGLLVRADKEEDKQPKSDESRETSFSSLRKLTSRLSVTDLVSVFERSAQPQEKELVARSSAEPASSKAVEKGVELLQSTTPDNSPPRPERQTTTATAPNAGAPFAWASASPTRAEPPALSQPSQPPSQSTQSNTCTYVGEGDHMVGTFTQTQETAVASQTSTQGEADKRSQPARKTTEDDEDYVEDLIDGRNDSVEPVAASQKGKSVVKTTQEKYLFEGTGETSMFATYDHAKKGAEGMHHSNNFGASSTTVVLNTSTSSQIPTSTSGQGLFAQAGAFVSKAFGMNSSTGPGAKNVKPSAQSVKSLQLAAAAAKKEQMEKDRKAARAKEIEDRRVAVAQRKLDEEKTKEEDARKAKAAELERRKREREEASAASRARLYKTKPSSDDESNKKRKLNAETDRKPSQLKKAPSQDTLRKGMKTPTPGAGPSTILKSSKAGTASSRPTNTANTTMNKSTNAARPALPLPSGEIVPVSEAPAKASSTAQTMDITQAGPSALTGGAVRASVVATTKSVAATGPVRQSKVKEDPNDRRQPLQAVQAAMQARAQAQMQAAQQQVQEQARLVSEDIVLPDIASEYSDSDDENRVRNYVIPIWANSPQLRDQLQAQSSINPDDIFGAIRPLHMDEIFRTRQSRFRARTSSANWAGQDRLTPQEEMEYARRMGFM